MKPLALGLGVIALLTMAAQAPAGTRGGAADKTLSPYFFVPGGDPDTDRLPLKETRADVQITGVIADVLVTQVYRNEGTRPIHARYVFPASTRAAVHGMTLQIGDHRIRAEIREREAARQEFDRAAGDGKSAALLEEQRPNVFSMNVANVMPQDEIRVELHYSEILVPTDGTYEFVYPAVVGPRYSNQPEATAPASDRWVHSPFLAEGQAPTYAFEVETRIAAGMPIQEVACASHQADVEWEDEHTAHVRLRPSETEAGNRDYVLRYRLEGEEIQTGLLLYPDGDEGFFLLLVEPPKRVAPEQIPPREYLFVLDVSGSMEGFPLASAKYLMHELVRGLRPVDRFNVLFFAGASYLLAPASLPATPENLEAALATVDSERGGGGTELVHALGVAMALPETAGVARSVVVITDGYVNAEAAAFDLVRANLGHANLFAVGIGSSVNRYLIEGLARAGQGEPFVVTDAAEAPAVAERFRDYVASPVLTDIALEVDGFDAYDIEPPAIPDLFADRPLVIFGKWRGAPTGTIRITGVGGAGAYAAGFEVADAQAAEENIALRYLWARARVARLSDYGLRQDDESRREVTALGLGYDLLTPYTSFIAVHEIVRNLDGAPVVDQPLPLPDGVSASAVGNPVPEPGLPLLAAAMLLGLALARTRRAARRARQ